MMRKFWNLTRFIVKRLSATAGGRIFLVCVALSPFALLLGRPKERVPDERYTVQTKSAFAEDATATSTPDPPQPTGPCGKKAGIDCPAVRVSYAIVTQEALWKQGKEITVSVKGRKLIFEYALAGKAFSYNFGNDFVNPAAPSLREMGFTKVVISDGTEDIWEWRL